MELVDCDPATIAAVAASPTLPCWIPVTVALMTSHPLSGSGSISAAQAANGPSAKLFVVEAQGAASTRVFRYDVGPMGIAASDVTIADATFDRPFGLAFSDSGEMFVINWGSPEGSVSRFLDPLAASPSADGTITSPSFSGSHGGAFRLGELFIAQGAGNNVLRYVFDANGVASPNGAITAGISGFAPRAATVNPATGELFITQCCGQNKINRYLFDGSGNAIPNGFITGPGLSNPHGIVFSPWGELFVANFGSGTISRFAFDAFGNASPNGQIIGLSGPMGLDFSPWGELFVSSHSVPLVYRFTFDASFVAIANGSFSSPTTLGYLQFPSGGAPFGGFGSGASGGAPFGPPDGASGGAPFGP